MRKGKCFGCHAEWFQAYGKMQSIDEMKKDMDRANL